MNGSTFLYSIVIVGYISRIAPDFPSIIPHEAVLFIKYILIELVHSGM